MVRNLRTRGVVLVLFAESGRRMVFDAGFYQFHCHFEHLWTNFLSTVMGLLMLSIRFNRVTVLNVISWTLLCPIYIYIAGAGETRHSGRSGG